MALFKVDPTKHKPPELLPAEVPLPVECFEASEDETQVETKWRIFDGPYAGRTQWFWLTKEPKSEKQEKFILSSIAAMGWDVKGGQTPNSAEEFVGKKAVMVLKHDRKQEKDTQTGQYVDARDPVSGDPIIQARVYYFRAYGNAPAKATGW